MTLTSSISPEAQSVLNAAPHISLDRTASNLEKIRTQNNINWMDLLRLAFKSAPEEAILLVRRINSDDQRISKIFAELGK